MRIIAIIAALLVLSGCARAIARTDDAVTAAQSTLVETSAVTLGQATTYVCDTARVGAVRRRFNSTDEMSAWVEFCRTSSNTVDIEELPPITESTPAPAFGGTE